MSGWSRTGNGRMRKKRLDGNEQNNHISAISSTFPIQRLIESCKCLCYLTCESISCDQLREVGRIVMYVAGAACFFDFY